MNKARVPFICLLVTAALLSAQTKDAYSTPSGSSTSLGGLLDPSRFSIHHSMGFEASSSNGNGLKSQSLYSSMITYKFAQPVTLNLNFSLPIYSTYSTANNLTPNNLKSLEYFKNMPFDASLTWQPQPNLLMQISVVRRTVADYYSPFYSYSPYRGLLSNQP
jgi:hypothetical protein